MATPTHYQTLGLQPTASAADIKKAYRKLARKHHPDISKASDATARMAAVNAAHEVLSDPVQRAIYDAPPEPERPARSEGAGPGFRYSAASEGLDADFFEQLFGRAGHGGADTRPQRGSDHHAVIELDLLDAYRGAERSVHLQPADAHERGGPGAARVLQMRVPVGVFEGQQIRVAGQGRPGQAGGAPGDLLLTVHFKADKRWRSVGRDVYQRLPLAPWEAALGATALVHTPGGDAEVNCPAGWQPGRQLRLKGRGIPGSGTQAAGHLYLELELALPAAGSDEERAAYTAYAAAFPGFSPRSAAVA